MFCKKTTLKECFYNILAAQTVIHDNSQILLFAKKENYIYIYTVVYNN